MAELGWIEDENDVELLTAWETLKASVGNLSGWQYRGSSREDGKWQHSFLNKYLRDGAESAEDEANAHRIIMATETWEPNKPGN